MRFGLIGYGRIAKRHTQAIAAIGGEVTAICDPAFIDVPLHKRPAGACLQLDAEFYDNCEWVVICSPTFCHFGQLRKSIYHGKKVICEKPVVLPWEPVVDNKNVFVVMQLRWAEGLPATAEKIFLRASRNEAYFDSWKGDANLTGGLFFDAFIHYVDMARRYKCVLDVMVRPEGEQYRMIDNFDLMGIDMDIAYQNMYRDVVFRDKGVRPSDISELNWMLARYTERFGTGRQILNKQIMVRPDELV